jgi:hypothetical protein
LSSVFEDNSEIITLLIIHNKIKFFMRVDEPPRSDWLLTLKGMPYSLFYPRKQTLSVWVFVNNQTIGHWIAEQAGNEITLRIPKKLFEESFEDPTRLLTVMLRMPEAPFQGGEASPLGVELKELYLRPVSDDSFSLLPQNRESIS